MDREEILRRELEILEELRRLEEEEDECEEDEDFLYADDDLSPLQKLTMPPASMRKYTTPNLERLRRLTDPGWGRRRRSR